MLVHVKKKAQITIPMKIRETVGIAEGDILEIKVKDNEIVLKPAAPKRIKVKLIPAKELKKLAGIISLGGDAVKDSEAIYD